MAGSSLLTLIDDIASLLDDVAAMTKFATRKTAGVLGDDLALNANQVSGVQPDRELPVVWAVAKGSLINKAILVPAALLISAIAPWAILPLLMIGGLYLCFEGAEKLAHRFLHSRAEDDAAHAERAEAVADPNIDLVAFERDRIKGAIRTDFILSAEIIVITLGTVASAAFSRQVGVLVAIALLMTVGVYGLVAAIVKLDDLGLHLSTRPANAQQLLGRAILRTAPHLMHGLSVLGTAAMFLVGGGILVHGIGPLHHLVEDLAQMPFGGLISALANGLIGLVLGLLTVLASTAIQRLRRPVASSPDTTGHDATNPQEP